MSDFKADVLNKMTTQVATWLTAQRYLLLIVGVLFVWLLGLNLGWFSGVSEAFNQHDLVAANASYLAYLETKLLADYSAMLGLSALVDVAASSQFGVDFIVDVNVQVGELLNNLSQVLEQGKSYLLWAMAAVGALEIIALLSKYIAPVLFHALLWALFIWLFAGLFRHQVLHSVLARQGIRTLLVLFLVSHIALPYSIHLSASATRVMDSALGFQSNHQYFKQFADELSGQSSQAAQSDLK